MAPRWRLVAIAGAIVALAVAVALVVPRVVPHAPAAGSTPPARPSASASPRSRVPVRLVVPSIGVDASVEKVGVLPNGDMDVPHDPADVAWYAPGVKPGMPGDAVVAGHLDSPAGAAVFARLASLRRGDRVTVVYDDGGRAAFTVTRVATYGVDEEPAYLFGAGGAPTLSLITCAGAWDGAQYTRRLVVDAAPA